VNGKQRNFSSIVGRYANRIAKGAFSIDGKEYKLVTNNGANHLHGGPTGFWSRVFRETKKTVNNRTGNPILASTLECVI
jgi:aldose 1-epimerase